MVQSLAAWGIIWLCLDLCGFPTAAVLLWNVSSAFLLLDLFMEALGTKAPLDKENLGCESPKMRELGEKCRELFFRCAL